MRAHDYAAGPRRRSRTTALVCIKKTTVSPDGATGFFSSIHMRADASDARAATARSIAAHPCASHAARSPRATTALSGLATRGTTSMPYIRIIIWMMSSILTMIIVR